MTEWLTNIYYFFYPKMIELPKSPKQETIQNFGIITPSSRSTLGHRMSYADVVKFPNKTIVHKSPKD